MLPPRTSFIVTISLALAIPTFTQQSAGVTAQSNPQALTLLQQSLASLSGSQSIADITLTGNARRIAGSLDETGAVTYKAISGGSARFDFSYPSGPGSEIRSTGGTGLSGAWSGRDGVTHPLVFHNLTNSASIFPAYTLAGFTSAQNFVVTLIGQETKNGAAVYHLTALQENPTITGAAATLPQHLSQVDVYLDTGTLLPVAFDYNTHPDNDALLDIPAEIRFSNYQVVNKAQIPFHVQKYLNNGLVFDLQVQSAVLNSGVPASTFQVQ